MNHRDLCLSAIHDDQIAISEPTPLEELNHVNHRDLCLSAIYKDTPQEIKIKGTNAFSQMYPDILDLNDPTITPLYPQGTEPNKNDFKMSIVVDSAEESSANTSGDRDSWCLSTTDRKSPF